jgi:hypothetical protein
MHQGPVPIDLLKNCILTSPSPQKGIEKQLFGASSNNLVYFYEDDNNSYNYPTAWQWNFFTSVTLKERVVLQVEMSVLGAVFNNLKVGVRLWLSLWRIWNVNKFPSLEIRERMMIYFKMEEKVCLNSSTCRKTCANQVSSSVLWEWTFKEWELWHS